MDIIINIFDLCECVHIFLFDENQRKRIFFDEKCFMVKMKPNFKGGGVDGREWSKGTIYTPVDADRYLYLHNPLSYGFSNTFTKLNTKLN